MSSHKAEEPLIDEVQLSSASGLRHVYILEPDETLVYSYSSGGVDGKEATAHSRAPSFNQPTSRSARFSED